MLDQSMCLPSGNARVIGGGRCLLLPDRSVCRFLATLPLPGVVILVHGVNSDGEWYEAVEKGLCEGLNNRLARQSRQLKYDGVEAGQLEPVSYTPELDADGYLDPNRDDRNFIAVTPSYSPVIRFRWGYKADLESVKEWGANVWLNENDYWGGGPFANGCTTLADLWSEGLYERLFLWITAQHLNPVPGRDAYSCPHRGYYVHAALRLARLVASVRARQADCPITIVCHSQGNMIGMAAAFLGERFDAVADTYVLANPPYSLLPDNGVDNWSQRYTRSLDGRSGRQNGQARIRTLAAFVDLVRARRPTQQPADLIDRYMANPSPLDGSPGFDAASDRARYGLHGATIGRVTLYCNPHDQVISASPVQGMGWLGLSNDELALVDGEPIADGRAVRRADFSFTQRVFAQGWTVGTLGCYDFWAHHETLATHRPTPGFWFPASPVANYSIARGLTATRSPIGALCTLVFAPLAWAGVGLASARINADPPKGWKITIDAPALATPFLPESLRYGVRSTAFDEDLDPEGAARNAGKTVFDPDDPYDTHFGSAGDTARGSQGTEAELRYAHRARLRMEARRSGQAATDGSVPGEAPPPAGATDAASDDYRVWRTDRISRFLADGANQSATDHSTILTHPMHAERALAYDVAVGDCRLTQEDWRVLRVEADWRYALHLGKDHPNYELSEYFEYGLMDGLPLSTWIHEGDAAKPDKIVDERTHVPNDPPEHVR